MLAELADLLSHGCSLAGKELFDGLSENGVANPMRTVNGSWHQTSPELVGTLGAGFETPHPVLDGMLDEPIVAELEVKHVVSLRSAPISAV